MSGAAAIIAGIPAVGADPVGIGAATPIGGVTAGVAAPVGTAGTTATVGAMLDRMAIVAIAADRMAAMITIKWSRLSQSK